MSNCSVHAVSDRSPYRDQTTPWASELSPDPACIQTTVSRCDAEPSLLRAVKPHDGQVGTGIAHSTLPGRKILKDLPSF